MSNIGGKRPGAGRKALHGERKETTSMRLTPTVRAYLKQCDESDGEVVEAVVRRTAAFRKWVKEQVD